MIVWLLFDLKWTWPPNLAHTHTTHLFFAVRAQGRDNWCLPSAVWGFWSINKIKPTWVKSISWRFADSMMLRNFLFILISCFVLGRGGSGFSMTFVRTIYGTVTYFLNASDGLLSLLCSSVLECCSKTPQRTEKLLFLYKRYGYLQLFSMTGIFRPWQSLCRESFNVVLPSWWLPRVICGFHFQLH